MFNSKLKNFSLGKSLGMSLVLLAFVVGCGEQTEQQVMVQQAVKIEQADSCHLCGMTISNFPGPKGESYASTQDDINKFCSTRDLFGFILQPENKRQVKEVFVHDMSKTPWGQPNDEHFIDAKQAWFVIGSTKTGAMGQTLGSFSVKSDAEVFMQEFGGQLYQFDDITLADL
ncbi:MAG: nitrous oxide reductase accessory protein NosL [Moritella sp.]|uniref:nitrous oxide reductase accessory protein NosL n=1 Tax=Moritella sp. TaxID=78556 RepID=UPI0025D717FA|nr:nitrous oxide reductase accessory protein NosL [Moritella sp.]NQZ93612.1 nitrous oxide reductase accessory protein NosL [Moritella sp.]